MGFDVCMHEKIRGSKVKERLIRRQDSRKLSWAYSIFFRLIREKAHFSSVEISKGLYKGFTTRVRSH